MQHKDIILLYNELTEKLRGDWLLVGGALLHVLNISDRVTLDLNLVPLDEITNTDQLNIMKVAESNNFPPETINFSAEYFVKKQKNWRKELVILFENENVRLYRPSKKLFRLLKEQRGTETDLMDIEMFEKKITVR